MAHECANVPQHVTFSPATVVGNSFTAEDPSLTAAGIRYIAHDGASERDLCWFGDDEFLPHRLKILGRPSFTAEVRFSESRVSPDRRVAASTAQAEVEALRASATE